MFKPRFKRLEDKVLNKALAAATYFPTELASLYSFPHGDGTGQKIAIIELCGGFRPTDLLIYFHNLGISKKPNVTSVSVDGGCNDTSDRYGANFQVALDIETISSIVPNAEILVYFAPNNYSGFYNAINTAINQSCKVINISWGAAETLWSHNELNRFNTLFARAVEIGCCITAAIDGDVVDFPASSPYVLSVGGTSLAAASELIWTESFVSTVFDTPDYQLNLAVAKRKIPDVSANADPETGYRIFVAGNNYIVGGTGAAAALWAALIARLNQCLGKNIGSIHRQLYKGGLCRSSPNGTVLFNALRGPEQIFIAKFSPRFIKQNPFTVRFMDASIGKPVRWSWDFGDGKTLTDVQSPTHIYTKLGSSTITLTITDKSGNTSTFKKVITVTR
jgi:kumamolisin